MSLVENIVNIWEDVASGTDKEGKIDNSEGLYIKYEVNSVNDSRFFRMSVGQSEKEIEEDNVPNSVSSLIDKIESQIPANFLPKGGEMYATIEIEERT